MEKPYMTEGDRRALAERSRTPATEARLAEERADVVAYLRGHAYSMCDSGRSMLSECLRSIADEIESGEHEGAANRKKL
jgi:hypothetical protein